MNLLIVEDQQRLALALKAICEEAGHRVDLAFDGKEGLDYALLGNYDAIVLDVMLPKLDGFEVIAALRKKAIDTPVIMLTARSAVGDKIKGLDLGADDYLTKPFNPDELLARLNALTRRVGKVVLSTISLGNTFLSLETADITLMANPEEVEEGAEARPSTNPEETVHLSQREFEVLKMFMGAPGKTFSKMDILDRVWGPESDAEENSVEVYISFLRKKLAHIGSNLNVLTIRSMGYRVEVDDA